jgi:micrococcal nuclease
VKRTQAIILAAALLFACLSAILLFPQEKPKKEISWEEAADYYGQTVWVRGKVVAANNTGKVCFLNFHRNWKRYFTVVIFASSFPLFPEPPEKLYLNKEIRVYGRLKEYQGKPEIIVESPDQIEIIK